MAVQYSKVYLVFVCVCDPSWCSRSLICPFCSFCFFIFTSLSLFLFVFSCLSWTLRLCWSGWKQEECSSLLNTGRRSWCWRSWGVWQRPEMHTHTHTHIHNLQTQRALECYQPFSFSDLMWNLAQKCSWNTSEHLIPTNWNTENLPKWNSCQIKSQTWQSESETQTALRFPVSSLVLLDWCVAGCSGCCRLHFSLCEKCFCEEHFAALL